MVTFAPEFNCECGQRMRVVDSKMTNTGRRRRYQCDACGSWFSMETPMRRLTKPREVKPAVSVRAVVRTPTPIDLPPDKIKSLLADVTTPGLRARLVSSLSASLQADPCGGGGE